jgi:hypothetical protein
MLDTSYRCANIRVSMENKMKNRSLTRTILVGAVTLSFFVLIAALSLTTRAMKVTRADAPITIGSANGPGSPPVVWHVLLPKSTAAYNGVTNPAKTVYAPWLLGGTSVLRVYNSNESLDTTVRATFTYSNGSLSIDKVVPAGAVADIEPTDIPTGTQLSAILTATQPIAAVVNDFGPTSRQATSYATMAASLGQTFLALPDIFSNSGGGWNSQVVVQNVGQSATQVTIFYTQTEPVAATSVSDTISALGVGESHTFYPSEAGMLDGAVGIATVVAEQPVIAIVRNAANELGVFYPRQVYVYRVPLPGGDSPSHFFPILLNDFQDWEKSQIQLMNADSETANLSLEIIGEPPVSKSVEPWSAVNDRQNDDGRDPEWIGSGRVRNAPSIHGLVWLEGNLQGDAFAAYSVPRMGAKASYLPYTDQGDRFATFVAVQNLSDASVSITLTYHTVTGTVGSPFIDSIDPSGAMKLYTGKDGLPASFVGGMVVQADQPVTAVSVIAGRLVLDKLRFMPLALKNQ